MTFISLHRPSGFWQQLAFGARKQASVIAALMIKDFKARSSKGRLGIVWLILDPMLMLVMMAGIWYVIGRTDIEGVPVFLYLSSGLITFSIVKQGISSVPTSIKANSALLNFPQVRPISCLVARFLFEMFLMLVTAFILYFGMWWIWDLLPAFNDPLGLFQVLGIAMVFGLGLSLLLGVYGTLYDSVAKLSHLVSRPLLFFSCVIHSLTDLPTTAQHYVLYNPITHLVVSARIDLFNLQPIDDVNLVYPTIWAFSLLGLGIVAYYVNRFRLIHE